MSGVLRTEGVSSLCWLCAWLGGLMLVFGLGVGWVWMALCMGAVGIIGGVWGFIKGGSGWRLWSGYIACALVVSVSVVLLA